MTHVSVDVRKHAVATPGGCEISAYTIHSRKRRTYTSGAQDSKAQLTIVAERGMPLEQGPLMIQENVLLGVHQRRSMQ